MSGQDDRLAGKITDYLDRGTADLRPGVAYRLQRARAEALARLAEPERATRLSPAYATGGTGTLSGGGRPFYQQARFWLAVAVVVAALFGTQQWDAFQQRARELADIDTQILTSDLPIDAYVDRGFQNWLRTSDTE